jgi:hypothetical protein
LRVVSSERFDVAGSTLAWTPIGNGTTCTLAAAVPC